MTEQERLIQSLDAEIDSLQKRLIKVYTLASTLLVIQSLTITLLLVF